MRKPIKLLPRALHPATVARFWAKVKIGNPDECWPWVGEEKFTGKAYGTFKLGGEVVTSSRVAYATSTNDDPLELSVLHTCDNPPCCNPSHLYKGTVKQNSQDMIDRGRWRSGNQKGSANGVSKLTEADIPVIRARIAAGETNVAIARDYAVTHQMISKIRRGHFWQHVPQKEMEAA